MGRPKGSRNADHDAQRAALVQALLPRLLDPDGADVSMRELARLAGVSPSTLLHYFETREELVEAALETSHALGKPYMDMAVAWNGGDVRAALVWFLRFTVTGWRTFGVGRIHTFGLRAGLGSGACGSAYVSHILEPTLDCAERRLSRHVERGEIAAGDLRAAALALVAPLVLALLHQDALEGAGVRPLDVDTFIERHVDGFLRGYAAPRA